MCVCVVYVRYVCCVYCGVCDVHVDVSGQQPVTFSFSTLFFETGLSLNKGLTDSAGLTGHWPQGSPVSTSLPSAEVIGTHHHCVQQYLNMGSGD